MTNDDSLGALILGGGLGYLLAHGQNSEWKPIMEGYKTRLQQVEYARVPFPTGFLKKSHNIRVIYRQSLSSYLFGLPDACMPMLMRVLEQALKLKYEEMEGKKPSRDLDLAKLIDWAESILKNKANVAHSFRMLRNLLHSDQFVQEQDCLEGIRHVNIIIENLFPGDQLRIETRCPHCGFSGITFLTSDSRVLANTLSLHCGQCSRVYSWLLMP